MSIFIYSTTGLVRTVESVARRGMILVLAGLMSQCPAYSQTVDEIISNTQRVYTQMRSYDVQINKRTFACSMDTEASSEGAAAVRDVTFTRLTLKWRAPSDWLLVKSFAANDPTSVGFSRALVKAPDAGAFFVTYKQGVRGERHALSDDSFQTSLATTLRLTQGDSEPDPVLKLITVRSMMLAGSPWAFSKLVIAREELAQGLLSYRIEGQGAKGEHVILWISKSDFTLLRYLTMVPGPKGEGDSSVAITETTYTEQRISEALSTAEFVPPASVRPLSTSSADYPFEEDSAVVSLVRKRLQNPISRSGLSAADTSSAKNVNHVRREGNQVLYPEEMRGIVLITGDGTAASGFITRMRDVDFVVTNLHVLGGAKKLSIKTLHGEEIPVVAVFGALGSDIALIRIPPGDYGRLKLAENILGTKKLGETVAVIGNRQGGGVATQVTGSIVGFGPTSVEVTANFESGNSGSPIVSMETGEVIAVATYSMTRRIELDDGPRQSSSRSTAGEMTEKRWFGYRLDSVSKWEPIDLSKWDAQRERIQKFRETSEALHALVQYDFRQAREHPRLTSLIDQFESKWRASGGNSLGAASAVKDFFRVVRSISEDGMRDLQNGSYYDYFRTCLYWEHSITAQLDYREKLLGVLKKYEANSNEYLSRMRSGG